MGAVLDVLGKLKDLNLVEMVGALSLFISVVLIPIALIVPGNQPEGFLKKVVDFLAKFSKK